MKTRVSVMLEFVLSPMLDIVRFIPAKLGTVKPEMHSMVEYMKELTGRQFDQYLLNLFLDNLQEVVIIKEKYAD